MKDDGGQTTIAARIEHKLKGEFDPQRLRIVDESHKHAGHSGWQPGGETHFRVDIVAAAFIGQSRVARQRLVYQALSEELEERVHALTLRTFAPEEDPRRDQEATPDRDPSEPI
ncbi:BolA family protein [Algihabitans albus]|uniref:BolA family protein n=1 Tax=Algihabitans albus TaxID=2164067 RepID=UPI000E5C7AE2|nr:BolA family protein [Algihabitans albus]